MKIATVKTVQGIGDIFWVYQKLAPHFDELHLKIATVHVDHVQHRAKNFLTMLPKVKSFQFVIEPSGTYDRIARTQVDLDKILADGVTEFEYAVNAPMEKGTRIEDLDKAAIEQPVRLKLEPFKFAIPSEPYVCVYHSGNKINQAWTERDWADISAYAATKLGATRIILTGAMYDKGVQQTVAYYLTPHKAHIQVQQTAGTLSLSDTINVIRNSKLFFGYQSGLNVLADNYDTTQVMAYFNWLRPMHDTWVKPENRGTKFFACCFEDDPKSAIDRAIQSRLK